HHHKTNGLLYRSSLAGEASIAAQLEDYTHLIHGLIKLYDASADKRWLERATTLLDEVRARHQDSDNGGFFVAPAKRTGPALPRNKMLMDGATISGNSMMLPVLIELYERTGKPELRMMAEQQISAFS